MFMFTVIPQNTFDEIQLDAGVLLKTFDPEHPAAPADEDIICATTGGITVSCVPTYSDFGEDIDNCPNNMKELKHLDEWTCTVSTTAIGTSPESIRLALGAADVSGTKITPRNDLKQTDFSTIWWGTHWRRVDFHFRLQRREKVRLGLNLPDTILWTHRILCRWNFTALLTAKSQERLLATKSQEREK